MGAQPRRLLSCASAAAPSPLPVVSVPEPPRGRIRASTEPEAVQFSTACGASTGSTEPSMFPRFDGITGVLLRRTSDPRTQHVPQADDADNGVAFEHRQVPEAAA
jgi:hypothetical protein